MFNLLEAPHRGAVCALLIAAPLAAPLQAPLAAQGVPPIAASDSVCTYDRCALWLDVPGLVQGTEGRLLAPYRWLRPLPLSRFVRGDSALQYATRYEHETRRARALSLLGGLASATGLVLAFANDCGIATDRCEMSNRTAAITITFIGAGIVVDLFAQKNRVRAGRARARALWWHNRQLVP